MQINVPEAVILFTAAQLLNTIITAKVTKTEMSLLRDSLDKMDGSFSQAIQKLEKIVSDHETRISITEDRAERHSDQLRKPR